MSGKKKGLGRGLSALFGDEKPNDKPKEIRKSNTVSISDLSPNPYQPRQNFKEEKRVFTPSTDDPFQLFNHWLSKKNINSTKSMWSKCSVRLSRYYYIYWLKPEMIIERNRLSVQVYYLILMLTLCLIMPAPNEVDEFCKT